LTGNPNSELAKRSCIAVDIRVDDEADPIAPAPTNSTTVALAMCDAIAITLMRQRGFTKEQFAIFHPGGHLGRKLLLTTDRIMHTGNEIPTVSDEVSVKEAIMTISQKRLGAVVIVDPTQRMLGILTDGDLRRLFEHHDNPLADNVSHHMTKNPIAIKRNSLAAEALRIMEDNQITVLPVTDENNKLAGVIHLHDLIRAGLA
jgi:arabinose-5-phosphate isomerase